MYLHIIEVDIFKQEGSATKIKIDNSKNENWIIQKIFDYGNSHSVCRKTYFRENELTDVNEESVKTQMKIPRGIYARKASFKVLFRDTPRPQKC